MADTADKQPPGHPVGQAIRWTPEQIEMLARLTEADEAKARELWREASGNGMYSLLDAKPEQS